MVGDLRPARATASEVDSGAPRPRRALRGTHLSVVTRTWWRLAEAPPLFPTEESRRRFIEDLGRAVITSGTDCLGWALCQRRADLLLATVAAERVAAFRAHLSRRWTPLRLTARRRPPWWPIAADTRPLPDRQSLLEALVEVHLSPLREGEVPSLEALADHPWSGHAPLMGGWEASFQDTTSLLATLGGAELGRRRLLSMMGETSGGPGRLAQPPAPR